MPKASRASVIRAEANEPVKPATMSFVRKTENENNVPKLARVKSGLATAKVPRKAFTELRNVNIPITTKDNMKSEKTSFDEAANFVKYPSNAATNLVKYPSIESFPTVIEDSDDEMPCFVDREERHAIRQLKNIFIPTLKPAFDYDDDEQEEIPLIGELVDIDTLRHWLN